MMRLAPLKRSVLPARSTFSLAALPTKSSKIAGTGMIPPMGLCCLLRSLSFSKPLVATTPQL